MEQSVKVVVIHNDSLVYEGIRAVLDAEPELELSGEARDVRSILKRCSGNRVEVAIAYSCCEETRPYDTLEDLKTLCSSIPTIVITSLSSPQRLSRLAASGPIAILEKETAAGELPTAIKAAVAGRTYLGPQVAQEMMRGMRDAGVETPGEGHSKYDSLSDRERQVFRMLSRGKTNKEIALELGISHKTVETYHTRLYQKLDIHHVVGLLRYAVRIGVIDFEEWVVSYRPSSPILPRTSSSDTDHPTPD